MRWIFAYGSLLWRPGFNFEAKRVASIFGWERRIWHSSIDHRGTKKFPGRVATIVPVRGGVCEGIAYGVLEAKWGDIVSYLDDREKAGYRRKYIMSEVKGAGVSRVVTYISEPFDEWVMEKETDIELIYRLLKAKGESGENIDYLMMLDAALKRLNIKDIHVSGLVKLVNQYQKPGEN